MARRRIQSNPFEGEQNFNQSNVLQNLSGLADMATLLQGQEIEGDVDLTGTAQGMQPPEEFQYPQVPRNPEMFEDQIGVDDVPGIPEGIELLGDVAGLEEREDALEDVGNPEPPVSLPQTSEGNLQDPLEFIRMRIQEEPELAQYLPEETRQLLESSEAQPEKAFVPPPQEGVTEVPEVVGSEEEVIESSGESLEEQMIGDISEGVPGAVQEVIDVGPKQEITEEDIPTEGLEPMAGSADVLRSDERLQQVVNNFLGNREGRLPPEVLNHVQTTNEVLTKEESRLNDTEKQLLERMKSGNLTSMDKVAIGIALALPVLIALAYGKDGFIAFSGGALKGLGEALSKGETQKAKDLEKLGAIEKERNVLKQKRSDLNKEVLSNIENPAIRKLFKNYDVLDVIEGEDGKATVKPGRDAYVSGDRIGISARDKEDVLYYDLNHLQDDEDVKEFKKNSAEGRQAVEKLPEIQRNISRITGLIDAIKEQDPGFYRVLKSQKAGALPGEEYNSITVDLVDENGNIKKVRALPLLKQETGTLMDTYRTGFLKGTRFSEHFQDHFKDIFSDVSDPKQFLSQDIETMRTRADRFENIMTERIISDLAGMGFLTEPLDKRFKKSQPVPRQSGMIREAAREQILSDPEAAKSLMR